MASSAAGRSSRAWTRLEKADRALLLPGPPPSEGSPLAQDPRWLELKFQVSELVAAFPGTETAIERYAPDLGPYTGANYPRMFAKRSTEFDDTIVLERAGVLKEKILLEYKTAKSTKKQGIDGNAHERLSFQILQYLEIATRYTGCTMVVISNGAFVKYRNKYHVSFHVQADRLSNFKWFTMQHASTALEYARFANGLFGWLLNGRERETR